jgi:hypothetical protein
MQTAISLVYNDLDCFSVKNSSDKKGNVEIYLIFGEHIKRQAKIYRWCIL